MSELADLRLAIADSRRQREAARRRTYDVGIALQRVRSTLANPSLDPVTRAEFERDRDQLEADLATGASALAGAQEAYHVARSTYDAAAGDEPALWEADGALPLLLLPVRLEAIFPHVDGRTELWLRVYPDDIHVDSHERELTDAERAAGERYWREVWAAGNDPQRREAAWRSLLDALGPSRAAWALEALRPSGQPPAEPTPPGQAPPDPGPFPEVPTRPTTWTRAPHTALLPDRFVFSAYKDGRLAWRHEGKPIPDTLPIGFAPTGDGDGPAPPDGLPWDEKSRWLIDFEEAVRVGMGRKVRLEHPEETFDLLTVVGVTTGDDPDVTATRWQGGLQAHQFSDGLAVLPARTPTNNTPATRSGWWSRPQPRPPEEIDTLRARFEAGSPQAAARAAGAFGIDGLPVLAVAPGAGDGGDDLEAQVFAAVGRYFGLSFVWRPLDAPTDIEPESVDMSFLVRHFVDHVRGRGPLPTLRVGRQPYGVLPVTSLDLWRGDDVDAAILDHVGSFMTTFEERIDRVPRVGDGADQDAVIFDLLSREPASRRVRRSFANTFGQLGFQAPAPGVVGSIGADTQFGVLGADQGDDGLMIVDDDPPEELRRVAALRPLAAKVQLAEDLRTATGAELQDVFARFDVLRRALSPLEHWTGEGTTYTGVFYPFAEDVSHYLFNLAIRASTSREPSADADAARRQYALVKDVCDLLVALEERAAEDMSGLEGMLCEALDTVSHRVDAWATSVAQARLARQRTERPTGLRVGAYGWLTEVGHGHADPSPDGYIVTPSMHHATTAAVLRSGWRAHSDKQALAVDLQSWRVRKALALIDGVRTGQPMAALLGYQFERGMHDAGLDNLIAFFRTQFPLPASVEPDAPGSAEARVAIGARNVVDGQALRLNRPVLGNFSLHDADIIRALIADLDDAVDAVGDLLLAESVHHLVGGNPMRAGLSADAIGRGDGLPQDFDVIRTPRSATTVTYHLGLLGSPGGLGGPAGWNDERALAVLEPAIEMWCRERLGPAGGDQWRFPCRVQDGEGEEPTEVTLASLGWCALDVVTAAQPAEGASPLVRRLLDVASGGDGGGIARLTDEGVARAGELVLVCGQLRAVLAAGTPLLATHIDPRQADGWATADLDHLHRRVGPWLDAVSAARAELRDGLAALHDAVPDDAEAASATVGATLATLADLGLAAAAPVPGPDVGDQGGEVLSRLDAAALRPLPAPPDPAARTAVEAQRWATTATAPVSALVGEHLKVVPVLRQGLPGGGQPLVGADHDAIADWLRDVALVRPAAAALDDARVAAMVLGGGTEGAFVADQTPADAATAWAATAASAEGPTARSSIVLHHDGTAGGSALAGLVVDSWVDSIPRPAADNGPEEIAGVAFNFDRPGSRSPQALLLAVPPDPARGWRAEDVHGVVEDTLTLVRIRSLDLRDVPELRALLPIPGAESA